MSTKTVKRWLLYCEPCSFKKIILENDSTDDLTEIPLAKTPGGSPTMDEKGKKTVVPSADGLTPPVEMHEIKSHPGIERNKMFKCPQCGRGVTSKKLPDLYVKSIQAEEDLKQKVQDEERKKLQEKRIADEEENLIAGREAGIAGREVQRKPPKRTRR